MRKIKTIYLFMVLLVLANLFLNNSGNPPNGKSGAPGDGTCADCHSGGGFSGSMFLTGLPPVVNPNTTYTVTLTNGFGGMAPTLSGFQLTARTNSNQEAGSLSNPGAGSTTTVFGGKTYLEHNPAQFFSGSNEVSWTFDWTAPNGLDGENYTFFYAGVFADGTGGTGGDAVSGGAFSVELDVPQPLVGTASVIQNVSCFGENDGVAMVSPNGGTPPYFYNWSNGENSSTVLDLLAGSYDVTISDVLSQQFTTSVTITEPSAINLMISNQSDVSCSSTGSAMASASGGNSGYNYQWSNGGTGQMQSFTAGGNYAVTVIDAFGCTASEQVNIAEDTTLPTAIINSNGSLSCTQSTILLDGSQSTGSGQLSFEWLDGSNMVIGTSSSINVSSEGSYTLQVTDAQNGCQGQTSVMIGGNTNTPTVNISGTTMLNCSMNTATLEASTNVSMPTYSWTDNVGNTIGTTNSITVNQAGVYTVLVADPVSGCSGTSSVTITENIVNPMADAGEDTNLTCASSMLTLNAMNSTPSTINFEWTDDQNMVISDSMTANIMEAGTYYLIVTDTLTACTDRDTVIVGENIQLPIADAGDDATLTCVENSISLNGNGSSTGDFSYLWTTTNGSIIQGETTLSPLVDETGTYTLTVTDNNNACTNSDTVEVTLNEDIPTADIANVLALSCNNTMVTLDGCASTPSNSIIYEWIFMNNSIGTTCLVDVNMEGVYTLIVTDTNNGCTSSSSVSVESDISIPMVSIDIPDNLDCSNSQVTIEPNISSGNTFSCQWFNANGNAISADCNLTVAQADIFTLVVTDVITGCTTSDSVEVLADAGTVEAVATALSILNCNNTCVILDPMGSSEGANITYAWIGPNGFASTEMSPCVTFPGTYILMVTDISTGCTNQTDVDVLEDTEIPTITIETPSQLSCSDLSVVLNVSTQTAGMFTFTWITNDGSIVSGANTSSLMVNSVGTYIVDVLNNENGCSNTGSVTVTAADSNIQLTTNSTSVDCNGSAIGSAGVMATGGVGPYMYSWSNGETTEVITGLAAGIYTVDVMDMNTCTATAEVVITEPELLGAQITIIDETAAGASDGTATATVSGGIEPYTYEWSNSATTAMIDGLAAGTYELTVTDANECVYTTQANIAGADCDLNISIEGQDNTCFGGVGGIATVSFMGADNPDILWSNGGTSFIIGFLPAGTYSVTVTESESCFQVAEITITEPEEEELVISEQINIDCVNEFGSVVLTVDDTISIEYDNLLVGDTSITIFNADVCITSVDVNILEIDNAPIANAGTDVEIILNCINTNLTATIDATGSSSDATLLWSTMNGGNIDVTDPFMPVVDASGTYMLTVTNDLGCTSTDEVEVILVQNTEAPIVNIVNPEIIVCSESTDSVEFDGMGSSQGANIVYEWINGIGDIVSTDIIATVSEPGFYSLIVTDNESGCTSAAVAQLIENDLSASFLVPSLECDILETEIEIIAQTNYPPVTYLWENGSTDSTITVTANELPSATVTDATGCTFVLDEVVTIIFTPSLVVSEAIVDATDGNANGSIDVTISGGTAPYIYMWSNGATTEDIENLEAGIYDLVIQDANGCEIEASYEVEMTINTYELPDNELIKLSPNPNTGQFWIEWKGANSNPVRLEIVDFTGKRVYQNNAFVPNTQAQLIQLENVPTGIYMVNFYTNEGLTASKKMMISQ